MDPKRVEELLRLYAKNLPKEKHLSEDAANKLKHRLHEEATQEEKLIGRQGRESGQALPGTLSDSIKSWLTLRRTVAALAAGTVLLLLIFYFNKPADWEFNVIYSSPNQRSTEEKTFYYFEVKPSFEAYVCILNLDPKYSFSCIFPYLDEEGLDDFGLTGPFPKGEKIRIPPSSAYKGFPAPEGEEIEFLYLIPSKTRFEEEGLREIIGELKKEIELVKISLEDFSKKAYQMLRKRFPGTVVRKLQLQKSKIGFP